LRSARACRIGAGSLEPDDDMVELLLLAEPLMSLEDWAAGAAVVGAAVFWGVVPVVPMGPPAGLCWPAPVAGFAGAVVGGLPCANATPARPSASAAMKLEVRSMVISPSR
jgi:hypothetical protein